MSLMSEPKYEENIPEAEEIGTGDLEEALDQGYSLMLEPASRLLYTKKTVKPCSGPMVKESVFLKHLPQN